MPSTFRERLKRARESRGYTKRQLDRMARLTEGMTSLLERGKRPNFECATAIQLAIALDVTLDWLAMGKGPDPFFLTPLASLRIAAIELVDPRLVSARTLESFKMAVREVPFDAFPKTRSAWEFVVSALEIERKTARLETMGDTVREESRVREPSTLDLPKRPSPVNNTQKGPGPLSKNRSR